MPTKQNKANILEAIKNWNDLQRRPNYFDLYHENVAFHGFAPGLPQGVAGLKLFYQALWAAFPDAKVSIEDMVAEGDKVSARYTFTGTHLGDFMGVPASGNRVAMDGITIMQFSNGKCVERWNQGDLLGLLQQIGAIPAH